MAGISAGAALGCGSCYFDFVFLFRRESAKNSKNAFLDGISGASIVKPKTRFEGTCFGPALTLFFLFFFFLFGWSVVVVFYFVRAGASMSVFIRDWQYA